MAASALPGVEADVVVIAAGRNERRGRAHLLHHLEAEHAAIKPQRPIEIGDLEVHMPDPRTGNNGRVLGHGVLRLNPAPLAGRGRRVAPGEGDSPRVIWGREPLTPTLSS